MVNAIILAAGMGSRLYPYTKDIPKCLLQYNDSKTLLEYTLDNLSKYNTNNIIVIGYKSTKINDAMLKNEKYYFTTLLYNPFYRITNSIVSLWMARNFLNDDVIIINSDVFASENIYDKIFNSELKDFVVFDSSRHYSDADYKVSINYNNNKVLSMGKLLDTTFYSGEYSGITKLSKETSINLSRKINNMVNQEEYSTWYETALVNLIEQESIELGCLDIKGLNWIELDTDMDYKALKKNKENII